MFNLIYHSSEILVIGHFIINLSEASEASIMILVRLELLSCTLDSMLSHSLDALTLMSHLRSHILLQNNI